MLKRNLDDYNISDTNTNNITNNITNSNTNIYINTNSIKNILDKMEKSYFSSFIEFIYDSFNFCNLYINEKFSVETNETSIEKALSNFEKVAQFNNAFGNNKIDKLTKESYDKHPKLIELLLSLIKEECQELEDAVKDKDPIETRDALSDILYVVYGMQYRLGIQGDEDFNIVHNSNMSKLCNNEEEAIKSVDNYLTKFQRGESSYDSPYFKKLDNINKWVIKNKSTGKVLKNINYKKVKFE